MPTGDLPRVPSEAPTVPKQGWYEDPARHHELRYFSQGAPTSLVRDGHVENRDEISMTDPELFEGMNLAKHDDTSPEPYRPRPQPTRFEWISGGRILVIRDEVPPGWYRSHAGPVEYALALLPWLVGFPVCIFLAAPIGAYVMLGVFSLAVVTVGAAWRGFRDHRSSVRRQRHPSPG